jgi:ribosomal protein S18 acetylase RimI-like enzyme
VTVSVRPARREDAIAMAQLARRAYAPYVQRIGGEPAPMKVDYAKTVDDGYAWVAEQHNRLIGLLVLHLGEDHMMLENVAVDPDAQGLGVGSQLLRFAEEKAHEQGLPQVRLYTNEAMTENLAYYPRRGYRETHRSTQNGYRRVFFAKTLEPTTGELVQ